MASDTPYSCDMVFHNSYTITFTFYLLHVKSNSDYSGSVQNDESEESESRIIK